MIGYSIITSKKESPIVEGRSFDGRVGSKIKWSCQEGRELEGEEEAQCLPTGEWSNPIPRCISRKWVIFFGGGGGVLLHIKFSRCLSEL